MNHAFAETYLSSTTPERARAGAAAPFRMRLGIHIRRGDIVDPATNGPRLHMEHRFLPNHVYLDAAVRLLELLPPAPPETPWVRPLVTIYSEGQPDEFDDIAPMLARRGYDTWLNLDNRTSRVYGSLAEADLGVLAPSSAFSCYSFVHLHRIRVGNERIGNACWGFALGDYQVGEADRDDAITMWYFALEWKLRRAEHLARCSALTAECLRQNPYLHPPLGPYGPGFVRPSHSIRNDPVTVSHHHSQFDGMGTVMLLLAVLIGSFVLVCPRRRN